MVATIGLAGCEENCRAFSRKGSLLGIHLCASVIGGAVVGMALGWLTGMAGAGLAGWTAVGIAAICAAYAASALSLVALPRPSTGRQVPISWRRLPPPVTAILYGAPLGAGVFTRIFDGTLYAVVVGIAVIGDAVLGAVALGAFGLGRGAFVFIVAGLGLDERDDVTKVIDRIAALRQHARTAAGVSLAIAAGFLVLAGTVGTFLASGG